MGTHFINTYIYIYTYTFYYLIIITYIFLIIVHILVSLDKRTTIFYIGSMPIIF